MLQELSTHTRSKIHVRYLNPYNVHYTHALKIQHYPFDLDPRKRQATPRHPTCTSDYRHGDRTSDRAKMGILGTGRMPVC